MSQTSVCITETLDPANILQGVVDGARSLTGARHGGATVLADAARCGQIVYACED